MRLVQLRRALGRYTVPLNLTMVIAPHQSGTRCSASDQPLQC